MKKALFSICTLAISLAATAQIVTEPEGKKIDNMYRHSESWVRGWVNSEPGIYEGLVSQIIEGTDGCLYVYNPLSGLESKSWMKLDKIGEGKYKAVFPQKFYKDKSGGDDDSEKGTDRVFTLNRLVNKGDNQYEVVAPDKNYIEFSWDGSKLQMEGMGTKQEILGMVDNSGVWDRFYGDWNITISTLTYKLPTPPTTGVKKQYTFTCAKESSPRVIDAIAEGNDLYLKGISKNPALADAWVKVTLNGNKATLLTNQYMGTSTKGDFGKYSGDQMKYHIFAAAFKDATTMADRIDFSVDTETQKLTTSNLLKMFLGLSSETNNPSDDYEVFGNMTLTPFVQKAAKPETPKLFYCNATPSYDYSTTTTILAFYVNNADVNGNYLSPDKMYYNVYVNDSKEPFNFIKSEYFYIDDDMTNIPFNYQDKKNDDIKSDGNLRILHFYDSDITKLSLVMVYDDGENVFKSEPLVVQPTSAGIESTKSDEPCKMDVYSVNGYKLKKLQKGLNIIKYSDGTMKKIYVK